MRHRDDRQTQSNHFPNFTSPHARSVDNNLGLDRAFVGYNFADATVLQVDRFNVCIRENPCTAVPGTDGKRVGETCRVDAAIIGRVCRADHAFDVHEWEHILRFFGTDQFHRHTK